MACPVIQRGQERNRRFVNHPTVLCCDQWEIVLLLITNMESAANYGRGQHVRNYN